MTEIQSAMRVVLDQRLVDHVAAVTQTSAICAACEPTARTIETTSPTRYGRRKPSRRTKVARYGTALTDSGYDGVERSARRGRAPSAASRRSPVRRDVRPAARARRMGERHDGHAVELEALADAVRELREPEQAAQREPADGHDQLRAAAARAPSRARTRRAPARAASACGLRGRTARGPGSSASPTRRRTSRRTRPRRARASGGASGRRVRATGAAPRPRRFRELVRTYRRADRRTARGPEATRAGSRPRRRRGSARGRAGAKRSER